MSAKMNDDLDNILRDDELLPLLLKYARDAVQRGLHDQVIVLLDEALAAKDAARAAKRQAELAAESKQQNRTWAKQKALALAVEAIMGRGSDISVWVKDAELRVYINSGSGYGEVAYYHTGNNTKPPKTLVCDGCKADAKPYVRAIIKRALEDWGKLYRMDCDVASSAQVKPAWPLPDGFAAYRAQRKLTAASEAVETAEKHLEFWHEQMANRRKRREDLETSSYKTEKSIADADAFIADGLETLVEREAAVKTAQQAYAALEASQGATETPPSIE